MRTGAQRARRTNPASAAAHIASRQRKAAPRLAASVAASSAIMATMPTAEKAMSAASDQARDEAEVAESTTPGASGDNREYSSLIELISDLTSSPICPLSIIEAMMIASTRRYMKSPNIRSFETAM